MPSKLVLTAPTLRTLAFAALMTSAAATAASPLIDSCADCHGKDGASTESDVPIIAGLSNDYLVSTMEEYRDGERPCAESKYRCGDTSRPATDMCKIAKSMSGAELTEVAAHFSALPFVRAKQTVDPAQVAIGKKVHELHCEKCHADGGSSKDDDSGILAGQWMPYLEASLKEYAEGTRTPPKKMKPKIDELSADDRNALLQFYGSFQ
ncbi:c-type cytochrome [Sinimarinibacterium sp. CAU 1509]|uniref:c-type cytochrome n=1 Tax=Sinimarinibacterium sp. CAU 1509 TaxID=2562283 RepID=UPI00146C463F|nr:c-type cytochrome [Sinimarinibacterium sp. CAU 1509]